MLFLIQSNSYSPTRKQSAVSYLTREQENKRIKIEMMNMANMVELFKALPRDIQWEVLSEFLGTHSVRKGKLIQKIVYTTFQGKIFRQIGTNKYLRIKIADSMRVRPCKTWLSNRHDDIPRYIKLSKDIPMAFWEDPHTGDTIYLSRTMERDPYIPFWKASFASVIAEDSVVLPAFVKHEYPSYEYTAKKNALRIR